MNDINTFIDFTADYLKVPYRFIWHYDVPYRSDIEPYLTIDGVKVYYTDNFDFFNDNPLLYSYIVYSDDNSHCILIIHKGIDFKKFFDYMIGYLGYDELIRHK